VRSEGPARRTGGESPDRVVHVFGAMIQAWRQLLHS
jgi:hypothetical protein